MASKHPELRAAAQPRSTAVAQRYGSPAATAPSEIKGDDWRVLICLLGTFSLRRQRDTIAVRSGGKTEALLQTLALRHDRLVPREILLAEVWPEIDAAHSGPALNSLVYNLHNLLGDALDGAAPVLNTQGAYRLNFEAGIGVDLVCFQTLIADGDRKSASGASAAITSYLDALDFYRGDLCTYLSDFALLERERLRASHLTLLSRSAAHFYAAQDYGRCLDLAFKLLTDDACREDAHRLVMLCYVARGERAQALRQYRICESILRAEFDATPEPATVALFDKIRLDPGAVLPAAAKNHTDLTRI